MAANVKTSPTVDSEDAGTPVNAVDVLIVGAGLSGIGAAVRLQRLSSRSYAILEARDAIGGTWDLFRFPGVRSDSDMYTLGYSFRPWTGAQAIADGASILAYIKDTAREAGVEARIRFGHRVIKASWCGVSARWTLEVRRSGGRTAVSFRCRFLYLCSGYYRYDSPHRPHFPNESAFLGTIVHPQQWPAGLDYAGKRVIVVGSGATAYTLVPEMAKRAAHVSMLQRSPSYVFDLPSVDAMAKGFSRWLPGRLTYPLVRMKNILIGALMFQFARRRPALAKQWLLGLVTDRLPPGFDVARHFTPRYNPWDQRVCVVTDGDLFKAIARGAVSVVTDEIDTFTATGIRLKTGAEMAADIVVSATGLTLNVLGDIDFTVDGVRLDVARCMAYKGAMLSGVPNFAYSFGYTNASWTLKAELTAGYVCRLLRHMDAHGYAVAVPRHDPAVAARSLLDFTSGYVVRAAELLPKQGAHRPWKLYQNYFLDVLALRFGRIGDGILEFSGRAA